MGFRFLTPWHAFLPRDAGHVVVFSGGGGKTSLLAAAAAVLSDEDVPLAVGAWGCGAWASPVEAGAPGSGAPVELLGPGCDGFDPAAANAAVDAAADRVVLLEAGAGAGAPVVRRRPDAPPLPRRASLVVPVLGLSAIGAAPERIVPAGETPPAADPELAVWNWEGAYALFAGPAGLLADAGVPAAPALLQLDRCRDGIGLFAFLDRLAGEAGVCLVVLGDTSGPEPRLRACYVEEPEDGATGGTP